MRPRYDEGDKVFYRTDERKPASTPGVIVEVKTERGGPRAGVVFYWIESDSTGKPAGLWLSEDFFVSRGL